MVIGQEDSGWNILLCSTWLYLKNQIQQKLKPPFLNPAFSCCCSISLLPFMVKLLENVVHSHCHNFVTFYALSSLLSDFHHFNGKNIVFTKSSEPSMLLVSGYSSGLILPEVSAVIQHHWPLPYLKMFPLLESVTSLLLVFILLSDYSSSVLFSSSFP